MHINPIIAGGPFINDKMIAMFALGLVAGLACLISIGFGATALWQGHHKRVGLAMVVIPSLVIICAAVWFFQWIRF